MLTWHFSRDIKSRTYWRAFLFCIDLNDKFSRHLYDHLWWQLSTLYALHFTNIHGLFLSHLYKDTLGLIPLCIQFFKSNFIKSIHWKAGSVFRNTCSCIRPIAYGTITPWMNPFFALLTLCAGKHWTLVTAPPPPPPPPTTNTTTTSPMSSNTGAHLALNHTKNAWRLLQLFTKVPDRDTNHCCSVHKVLWAGLSASILPRKCGYWINIYPCDIPRLFKNALKLVTGVQFVNFESHMPSTQESDICWNACCQLLLYAYIYKTRNWSWLSRHMPLYRRR